MAIVDLNDLLDDVHYVYNSLKEVVAQVMRKLQLKVDSEAEDPDADNSDFQITIPRQYYATHYISFTARSCTNDWNAYYNGYQAAGFVCEISLNDNVLNISNLTCIGKIVTAGGGQPEKWDYLDDSQKAECLNDIKTYYEGQEFKFVSDYPDLPTVFSYGSSGSFRFKPSGKNNSDFHLTYHQLSGDVSTNGFLTSMNTSTPYYDDSDDLIHDFPISTFCYLQKQPFEAIMDNESNARNWVNTNAATNNYETSYLVYGGTMKVFYGDNYIIYVVPSGVKVTYNLIRNITKEVCDVINHDNPSMPQIVVPTYNENKYGPEPEPVEDNDDYVDMGLGVETDGMAMYNMAVVTRDELIQLITDFEANADTGLSFIPHVLGLYKLGFESSQLLTTTSDKIRLHKEPSKTAFNSADNYNIVQNQEVLIDCGSITVDREELLTNTFLDFSPYTTYEMFIPGCGWITLPDTIVGRTISVSIVFDLTTCSCKGVVRSEGKLLGGSGTTLATVNGIIGSSVPLSINETGLQRAAIMNGSTQAAMALGTAFMGVGIGNPYMGASGVAMAASALASNHIAGNSTYTSTKGGATDYSVFGDGWKAVLKITRPVLEIPDNYGHSVGFVVNRYAQLSEFSGFTVCVNPHIHISATSDEKEEIKRLLEEGVILPEGE